MGILLSKILIKIYQN